MCAEGSWASEQRRLLGLSALYVDVQYGGGMKSWKSPHMTCHDRSMHATPIDLHLLPCFAVVRVLRILFHSTPT